MYIRTDASGEDLDQSVSTPSDQVSRFFDGLPCITKDALVLHWEHMSQGTFPPIAARMIHSTEIDSKIKDPWESYLQYIFYLGSNTTMEQSNLYIIVSGSGVRS